MQCGMNLSGTIYGQVVESCEHRTAILGSRNGGEFFDNLREY
jgi:hypothetical protein